MPHPSNGDEDEDLNHQENKRCRANRAARRAFGSAVEVGALPCPRPAVHDTVPLNRLVGKVEDFVAECDAEDAQAQHDKNETKQNGMVELLHPEIVDVQGKQREYKRIEQAKRFVGKRVVAVALRIGHEDQDERDERCQDKCVHPHERSREALLSLEKNEKARSEQKTDGAHDGEEQRMIGEQIEHVANEPRQSPVHAGLRAMRHDEGFLMLHTLWVRTGRMIHARGDPR